MLPPQDLIDLLREAQQVRGITEDARDFQTFMNPEGEDDEPKQQVELQEIIDYYTGNVGLEEDPQEADEPEPLPSATEALKALSIVQRYIEGQEDSITSD